MRDYVLELAAKQTGYNAKISIMREYLQLYLLRALHDEGFFRTTAFVGGTALRILYNLPRFSEDLDFSLVKKKRIPFKTIAEKLKQEMGLAGYTVNVSFNDKKTVNYAFVKFSNLLYDAGISPYPEQRLSVKIEVDTNPPSGAILETITVNKYFPISFLTYDLSSLFAGKIHALLTRRYTKGRDFFDIGWYLSRYKDVSPNIVLLKNALKQTKWKGEMPSKATWREFLYNALEKADWKNVRKDIEAFLENQRDLEVFTLQNILALVKK